METDQAEQVDALLSQSAKNLTKNWILRRQMLQLPQNMSPSPFNNQDTQIKIAVTMKTDTDLSLATKQSNVTVNNESIIAQQEVVPANLTTCKEQKNGVFSQGLKSVSCYRCLPLTV